MAAKPTFRILAAALLILVVGPAALSGSVRRAYGLALQRQVAVQVTAPAFVLVGDSLLEQAGWNFGPEALKGWRSVNLARGGAMISHATVQMAEAGAFRPRWVLVQAGVNDVVRGRSPQQIGQDYDNLLWQAPKGVKLAVTLIPPGNSVERNAIIAQANLAIGASALAHGARVIDLSPDLAPTGSIAKAYTTDGLHLSAAAYQVWRRRLDVLLTEP